MMAEQNKNEGAKKKRSWLKWVLILGIPLISISGTLGFLYAKNTFLNDMNNEPIISMKDINKHTIDSFTINLADMGSRRYLRTQVVLEYVDSKKLVKELGYKNHRIKDVVIDVFRSKKVEDLDSTKKTDALRDELLLSINKLLVDGQIIGLYFEEFIIQ